MATVKTTNANTLLGIWWYCSTSSGLSSGRSDMVVKFHHYLDSQKHLCIVINFPFSQMLEADSQLISLVCLMVTNYLKLGAFKITNIDCILTF